MDTDLYATAGMAGVPAPHAEHTTDVSTATAEDQDRVVSAMVLAFVRDPVMRWAWPEPSQYLAHFGAFTRAFGGRAFEHGSAHRTADFSGGALWLPPGVQPDEEALVGLIERRIEPKRGQIALAMLEQMGRHRPAEPYWYLAEIGVDSAKQGHGYGTALLRYALERVDREGKTAFLDSSCPQNIPLYERHGFKVIGTIQVEDAPPLFPMLRRSR